MKKIWTLAAVPIMLALVASFWHQDPSEWKITQLTQIDSCSLGNPQVSSDGRIIFLVSNCDLADRGSVKGAEIFKWEDGRFEQITDVGLCSITDLALSPDGQRLAFATDCELKGKNKGRGMEIAVLAGREEIQVLTQGLGFASAKPRWAADSRILVFESFADLVEKNPDHSREIYLADLSSEEPKIRQLSNTNVPGGCGEPSPTQDAVIALCNDDLAGTERPAELPGFLTLIDGRSVHGNPDLNPELVRFSFTGEPKQLTYSMGCKNGPPAVHPRGRVIAFVSDCDLAHQKGLQKKTELFLLAPELVRPFPDLDFPAFSLSWSFSDANLVMVSPFGRGTVNPDHGQEVFMMQVDLSDADLSSAVDEDELRNPYRLPASVTAFEYGSCQGPAPSGDGRVVAFISNANPDRRNNDGGFELFMAVHESASR